jgi:hypothetical protein
MRMIPNKLNLSLSMPKVILTRFSDVWQAYKQIWYRAWTRFMRMIPNKLNLSLSMPKVILTRFSDVWQAYKQIWYAPFIWAFAWYSYWIIYDSVVWNKPFAQLNMLNYIGATTSAIFILAASPIRRRLQKGVVFARTHLGRGIQMASVLFGNKIRKRTSHIALRHRQGPGQAEKPKLQEPQVLKSSHTGRTRRVTKSSQAKPQTQQPSSCVSSTLPSFDCSCQNGMSGGIDQCLICANLIDCTYRRNKPSELEVGNKSRAPRLSAEETPVEKVVAS